MLIQCIYMLKRLIQKWGNSAAVRLPAAMLAQTGTALGDAVELSVTPEGILIRPATEKRYKLAELVKGITAKNTHREVETGAPVGREEL